MAKAKAKNKQKKSRFPFDTAIVQTIDGEESEAMVINLLAHKWYLVFVKDSDGSLQGRVHYDSKVIEVFETAIDPVATLYHELAHGWLLYTGVDWDQKLNAELIVDIFGALASALYHENGDNFQENVTKFIEEKRK